MVIGKFDYHRKGDSDSEGGKWLEFWLETFGTDKNEEKRVIYTQNRIEMEFHAITQHFPRPVNSIAD